MTKIFKVVSSIMTLLMCLSLGAVGVYADEGVTVNFVLMSSGYGFCKQADMSGGTLTVENMKVSVLSHDGDELYSTVTITDDAIVDKSYIAFKAQVPSWKDGDKYAIRLDEMPDYLEEIVTLNGTHGKEGDLIEISAMKGDCSGYEKENGTANAGLSTDTPFILKLLPLSDALIVKVSDNGLPVSGIDMTYMSADVYKKDKSDNKGYAIITGVSNTSDSWNIRALSKYNGKEGELLEYKPSNVSNTAVVLNYKFPDGDGDGTGATGAVSNGVKLNGIQLLAKTDYRYDTHFVKDLVTEFKLQKEDAILNSVKCSYTSKYTLCEKPSEGTYRVNFVINDLDVKVDKEQFDVKKDEGVLVTASIKEKKALSVSKVDKDGKPTVANFYFKDDPSHIYVANNEPYSFSAVPGMQTVIVDAVTKAEYSVKILDAYPTTCLILGEGKIVGDMTFPPENTSPQTSDTLIAVAVFLLGLTIMLSVLLSRANYLMRIKKSRNK